MVTEPKDLPIGSVTFNDIGESSTGEYFVAPLKCGRQEFGKQSVKSTLGIMWNNHFSGGGGGGGRGGGGGGGDHARGYGRLSLGQINVCKNT